MENMMIYGPTVADLCKAFEVNLTEVFLMEDETNFLEEVTAETEEEIDEMLWSF